MQMDIKILKRLAAGDILCRRLVQPVNTSGVLHLGGSGYVVDLTEYGHIEDLVASGYASFRKTEMMGGDVSIEELWCSIEPKGTLFLSAELVRNQEVA